MYDDSDQAGIIGELYPLMSKEFRDILFGEEQPCGSFMSYSFLIFDISE